MRDEVERAIAEVLSPLIEADGGRIELLDVSETTITLRLGAACGGCPGAPYTRSRVIEPVLRRLFGANIQVRVERGIAEGTVPPPPGTRPTP